MATATGVIHNRQPPLRGVTDDGPVTLEQAADGHNLDRGGTVSVVAHEQFPAPLLIDQSS